MGANESAIGIDGRIRGRDGELTSLRQVVAELREGASADVLVVGEPGSGKSALLDFVRVAARDASVLVALVRPGGIAPSGVAATLAQALAEPDIAVLDPRVAEQMDAAVELRYWWLQELEAALEQIPHPLLIVIDDLQFADELTRLAARVMPRRLERSPVAWVIAQRSDDFEQRSAESALPPSSGSEHIVLRRLDEDAVIDIAVDVFGGVPDESIRSVLARAAGLPLRVVSSARQLREAGAARVSDGTVSLVPAPGETPGQFSDPIERRFELVSAPARDVVFSASVLGLQFTMAELLSLTELPPGRILGPITELLRSGLLRDAGEAFEFEHEIVRRTAESQLSTEERSALRRAAFLISRESDDRSSVLVRRALAAVEQIEGDAAGAPTRAEALDIVEEALGAVIDQDAQLAANLIERRLQLLKVTGAELRGAMAEAIPLLLHAGRAEAARDLARRGVAANMDPEEEAIARLALAQLTTLDQPTATRENLDVALQLPLSSPALRGRLAAMSTRPYTTDYLYDALETVLPGVRVTVQQSADDVALSTLEQVEAIAAFYRHEWAYAREAISRAEERGNRTAHPEAWFATLIRVSLLRCVGRPMDALRSIDREIRIADERQQAFALLHLQLVRANILLDLGRLDEAEIQAEAVRDLAEDIGAVWTIGVGAASILAQTAVYKDSPDVTDRLGPLVSLFTKDEVAHQRRGGEWIEMIFADLAGDSQTIEARTRRRYDRSRILGPPVGGASDTLDDVYFTRLVLGVGVPERARQVVSLARDRAQITGAPIASAVLDHVVGLVEGVPRLLVSAAETYHRLDRPLAESAAWEDLADMVRTAEPAEAVQALRRAHALLSECDATRSLARVEGRLRELGERPPARTSTRNALGLTAAEQRIVDRAVRNETATEIAAALYLSRNTVTAHLRRIYAKLGVRSREQMTEVVRLRGGVSR
jgi:DNA-binding CsgD family transcriptional regulator